MLQGLPDMDKAAFAKWLSGVQLLDRVQRGQAFQALAVVEADNPIDVSEPSTVVAPAADMARVAVPMLPAKPAGPALEESMWSKIGRNRIVNFRCPHCGRDDVRVWSRASGKPCCRCATCRKTFNPLTGTPLTGLHHSGRWSDRAQALIDGGTIATAARRCRIDHLSAFRWRHRFLSTVNLDKPRHLAGIVEADETFVLESLRGKRGGLARAPRKGGGKSSERGFSAEQVPVIVARDRTCATLDAVLPRLHAASVTAALGHVIAKSAQLRGDGGSAIMAFARRARVMFHVLPVPGSPKTDAPRHHVNNVNAGHDRLKEWMRPFHGVATKNLPDHPSWRRTIEALTVSSNPASWIMGAADLGPYQQAAQQERKRFLSMPGGDVHHRPILAEGTGCPIATGRASSV